tara:strand:+ start:467 stop:631 length:165 start_codon:yes stop_codon:yes gene_type:complete
MLRGKDPLGIGNKVGRLRIKYNSRQVIRIEIGFSRNEATCNIISKIIKVFYVNV